MGEKQNNTTYSDEIDLLELLAKVTLGIKNNIRSFVFAFVVGAGLGLAYYLYQPAVYEGKMIIQSDILTESHVERIAETMRLLIREENWEVLGSRMEISPEKAISLKKIEIEGVDDKPIITEEKDNNIFIITVQTKENSSLPELQTGIISYLKNNEFVKVRVKQKKEFYNAMIEKLGQEISSLDSLKGRLFSGKPIYPKSAELLLFDPINIYSEIIKLNEDQINYRNRLELFNSIQLVEGFTVYDKPVSPKLSVNLIGGSSFGVFFVLMLIGFKALRKIVTLSEEKLAKN
ncbi:MAG: hypothetical protein ORN54_12760 [Cyclobacteriaceae bacterium]|nr:hypothetical protein [Cyclobacteriaceae bacterium]